MKKLIALLARSDAASSTPFSIGDVRIATAALLLEMAEIDDNFSDAERSVIKESLRVRFSLSDNEVAEIIEAGERQLHERVDRYYFTNMVNEHCTTAEKIEIMELAWRVVFTDGKLDKYEDYLAHRFGELLRLDHRQMIAAKLKMKKELGIE